jgi:hypothetical protein
VPIVSEVKDQKPAMFCFNGIFSKVYLGLEDQHSDDATKLSSKLFQTQNSNNKKQTLE